MKDRVRLLVAGGECLQTRSQRRVDPIVMLGEAVGQATNQVAIIAKDGVDLVLELLVAVLQLSLRVLMAGREHVAIRFDQHVNLIVVMPERLVEVVGVALVVACNLVDLVFQCVVSLLERGVRPLLGDYERIQGFLKRLDALAESVELIGHLELLCVLLITTIGHTGSKSRGYGSPVHLQPLVWASSQRFRLPLVRVLWNENGA